VIDSAEIRSPTRYVVRGGTGHAVERLAPDSAALLLMLESDLYHHLYRVPLAGGAVTADGLARSRHLAALSGANNGKGCWEPGWKVVAVAEDGLVAVVKNGLTFWTSPAGLRVRRRVPRAGEACRVLVPKELRSLVSGYYLAIGDADANVPRAIPRPVVRLYWHLTLEAAAPYIAAVTSILNSRAVPFRTKLPSDPNAYRRADAAVLYLERRFFLRAADAVRDVHSQIAGGLRPRVPLFTKPLSSGLGLAEDPRNGLSFGQHRCRLAAQALWRSFLQGNRTRGEREATLAATFQDAQVNPRAPYLNARSRDAYSLPPSVSRVGRPR
jgi:hypothetical protein